MSESICCRLVATQTRAVVGAARAGRINRSSGGGGIVPCAGPGYKTLVVLFIMAVARQFDLGKKLTV